VGGGVISVYRYTGCNLDIINMIQSGRCTVAVGVISVYGYTSYNLEVINMSHIYVTTT